MRHETGMRTTLIINDDVLIAARAMTTIHGGRLATFDCRLSMSAITGGKTALLLIGKK
jgi:hypothetical protein